MSHWTVFQRSVQKLAAVEEVQEVHIYVAGSGKQKTKSARKIIKIYSQIDCCFLEASLDVTRIVSMENMEILEDGHPGEIKAHSKSKLADDLRDVNYESYNYRKKVGN